MLKLFIDESYQRDHYYVAGVLADEKQERALVERLNHLSHQAQARNHWKRPPEFHGHALMNGLEDWTDLRSHFGACVTIYQSVMHAVQNSGAKVFLEGVDVKRLNARYRYPESPHEITLRHLLERVNEFCAENGQRCQVVADTVPGHEEFNRNIQRFSDIETPGFRGQRLLCIEGDIEFIDSRLSRGVQAADMVAYILRRSREEQHGSKSAKRVTRRLVKALGPALVHERKWIP